MGYIVSKGWLALDSFDELRRYILDHHKVTQLVQLPEHVFEDAQVETMAFVFQREANKMARLRHRVEIRQCNEGAVEHQFRALRTIPQKAFSDTYLNVFDLSIEPRTEAVKTKMRDGPLLGSMYEVVFGLKTADDAKFLHFTEGKHKEDKPLLRGDDVRRYGIRWKGEYVWYVPKRMRAHRTTARPGEAARFEQPKVLVKDTTKDFASTYESGEYYVKDVLIVIPKKNLTAYDLRALAGIINSKALRFFYRTTFKTLHVQNRELASLPLPTFDLTRTEDKEAYQHLIELVSQMLDAQERRTSVTTEADVTYLDGRINVLDRRIDQLVYAAYGLDDADTAIIEETVTKADEGIELGRSIPTLPVSSHMES